MKYEKPNLEELELLLEGSFLGDNSVGIEKGDEEQNDNSLGIWG